MQDLSNVSHLFLTDLIWRLLVKSIRHSLCHALISLSPSSPLFLLIISGSAERIWHQPSDQHTSAACVIVKGIMGLILLSANRKCTFSHDEMDFTNSSPFSSNARIWPQTHFTTDSFRHCQLPVLFRLCLFLFFIDMSGFWHFSSFLQAHYLSLVQRHNSPSGQIDITGRNVFHLSTWFLRWALALRWCNICIYEYINIHMNMYGDRQTNAYMYK